MAKPRSGRYFNTTPTPDNFVALWNAIMALQDTQAQHATTLQQHTTDLASQSGLISGTQNVANQAVILAGKAVDQAATTVPPAGGGGAGGGGGSGDSHPNHYALIVQSVNELVALGEDLSGACGAFKVVQRAMPWIQASDPAAGFLAKDTGNNCGGFASDIVCYNDGVIYDVLIGGGDASGSTSTANVPAWNFKGTVDPGRYRATT